MLASLFGLVYTVGRVTHGVTDVFIEVNPRHAGFYSRVLGFVVAAGEGLRKGQAEQARNLGKDVMIVFHGRTSLQAGGTHAGAVRHPAQAGVISANPPRAHG